MTRTGPVVGAVLAILMACPGLGLADPVLNLTPPDGGIGHSKPVDEGFAIQVSGASSGGETYSPADEAQPTLQTRHFGAQAALSCKLAGTPNDLVVINHSPDPLPSGTRIKWQLKGAGLFGFFALLGELPGGQSLVADDVVAGVADQGARCVARVI